MEFASSSGLVRVMGRHGGVHFPLSDLSSTRKEIIKGSTSDSSPVSFAFMPLFSDPGSSLFSNGSLYIYIYSIIVDVFISSQIISNKEDDVALDPEKP